MVAVSEVFLKNLLQALDNVKSVVQTATGKYSAISLRSRRLTRAVPSSAGQTGSAAPSQAATSSVTPSKGKSVLYRGGFTEEERYHRSWNR